MRHSGRLDRWRWWRRVSTPSPTPTWSPSRWTRPGGQGHCTRRRNQPLDLEDAGLDSLFSLMARRHVTLEPTLLIFADNPPALRFAGAIANMAHRRGVTIVAGTDTLGAAGSDSLTLPNLHRELELLVTLAGLSPAEALEGATRDAAIVLGAQRVRGTIEVGKLADAVVLRSDPLRSIRNTRTIQLVLKRGRVYRRP